MFYWICWSVVLLVFFVFCSCCCVYHIMLHCDYDAGVVGPFLSVKFDFLICWFYCFLCYCFAVDIACVCWTMLLWLWCWCSGSLATSCLSQRQPRLLITTNKPLDDEDFNQVASKKARRLRGKNTKWKRAENTKGHLSPESFSVLSLVSLESPVTLVFS